MKYRFSLSVFFICFVLSLFSGCTDLSEKENVTDSNAQDFVIQLYDENTLDPSIFSCARLISPFPSRELSLVSVWKISFTDLNDSSNTFTLSTDTSASGSESYASLSDSTLTLKRIPESTYKIEVEGSFTSDSLTGTFYGNISSFAVGSEGSSVSIPVGLKKMSTGSLALTFTDSSSSLSDNYSKIKLNLKTDSGTESYDFEVPADSSPSGEFVYSSGDNTFTLTKSEIPSGYYRISFSYDAESSESGFKVCIPEIYSTVEVVDGVETKNSETINLSIVEEKNYYATNSSAAANKNGLTSYSKKYLKSLLTLIAENIANDDLEESTVNIYMGQEIPEIDADTYSTLVNAIKEIKKSFVLAIYGAGQTEKSSLTIMNSPSDDSSSSTEGSDSSQSLSSDINYSIVLTAGASSSTFNVNTLTATSGSPFTLTLKNGSKLVAGDDETSLLNDEITINAIKEDSEGNSEANYTAYLLADSSPLFECVWSGTTDTPCTASFVLSDSEDCGYELIDKTTDSGSCKTYFEPAESDSTTE